MPNRTNRRPAMYNTPTLRNGGFGALQVEAVANRPLSIARRHRAASQLRMREIEPDQLTSSEWVQFLVMEDRERERWIGDFNRRRRRDSDESTSSAGSSRGAYADGDVAASNDKAEEAEQERRSTATNEAEVTGTPVPSSGRTPAASLWARQFDAGEAVAGAVYSAPRARHTRRAVYDMVGEAPPTYETAVTQPPAYEPRSDDDEAGHVSPRRVRFDV